MKFRYHFIIFLLLCSLFLTITSLGLGQEPSAGDAAHFLRSGLGARAKAMGGAFVALSKGPSAVYWNPAGLSQQQALHLEGTYENRFGSLIQVQELSASIPWRDFVVGVSLVSMDIYSVYFLSFGLKLFKDLSFGITFKRYLFGTGEQRGEGLGIDFGFLYMMEVGETKVTVGFVSQDVGWSSIRWQGLISAEDYAAWVNRVGAALKLPLPFGEAIYAATWELSLRRPPFPGEEDYFITALYSSLSLGVEVTLDKVIAFRCGVGDVQWNDGLKADLSVGGGVITGYFALDFAVVFPSRLPLVTYVFSVEVFL